MGETGGRCVAVSLCRCVAVSLFAVCWLGRARAVRMFCDRRDGGAVRRVFAGSMVVCPDPVPSARHMGGARAYNMKQAHLRGEAILAGSQARILVRPWAAVFVARVAPARPGVCRRSNECPMNGSFIGARRRGGCGRRWNARVDGRRQLYFGLGPWLVHTYCLCTAFVRSRCASEAGSAAVPMNAQ